MVHYSIVVFACIAAAAHAVLLPGAGLIQPTLLTKQVETIDVRPQYTFSYEVKDPSTGDIKNQIESRDGDLVKGSYSLLDADGLTRVVQYTSDGVNGFNAIVSRTPLTKQVVAAAPTLIKSVPILQQPTLIKSIPTLLQAPTLIKSIPGPAYSSSSLVRAPPSIGLAVKSAPLLSSPLLSSQLLLH